MPINGVRVLPDIPKNLPKILIQDIETGCRPVSTSYRDIASKSSALGGGNFVKKIVEAYESNARTSNENNRRQGTSIAPGVAGNRKNVEKSASSPAICNASGSQCRSIFKKIPKVSWSPYEMHEIEDDFVIIKHSSESDGTEISETWAESSPKINMYSSVDELSMDLQCSASRRNEMWSLKRKNQKEDKTKNKLMICSSPLEKNKYLDSKDPLDDLLTSSCDSSSSNSYRKLQDDLYEFENDQWQFELSSNSSASLMFSEPPHDDASSMNNDELQQRNSSFQDLVVTSFKGISEDRRKSFRFSKPTLSNCNQKSQTSSNEEQPIKSDDTWMVALTEKLSQNKPLKKFKSAFNTKLMYCKKVWKKSVEKSSSERNFDSRFVEYFPSSSSLKFWRAGPSEKSPTFGTFGRERSACFNDKTLSKSSHMVLTEVPREELASGSGFSDSTPWITRRDTAAPYKENRGNVESSLKSAMLGRFSRLKDPCGYPALAKHPCPTQNGISKHPFAARTKLDQVTVEETKMRRIRCAKERESDTRELESLATSLVSQADLSVLHPKVSDWVASPLNYNDILRSCKSMSELDRLVPHQTSSAANVLTSCNFNTDFLSTVHDLNPYLQAKPCAHRYATVSPKNLRFSMSREKSRAIERSLDVWRTVRDPSRELGDG